MFTISCIVIIGAAVCYTGFHAWFALREIRSNQTVDQSIQPALSVDNVSMPMDDDLAFGSLTQPLSLLLPESSRRRRLQTEQLAAAGYHSKSAWCSFHAVRTVATFFSIFVVLCCLVWAQQEWERTLFALLILAPVTAWAIPGLWLASTAQQRTCEVERGLPDLLDILNMGISQGLPLPSVLLRSAPELQQAHSALSQELSLMSHQSQFYTLNHSLKQFGQRFDSELIRSFSSLLIQSQNTGTSLANSLKQYSDNFRLTLRQRLDAKANEASFKLLFPTTLCLLPAVFLFLLGPAIVDIANFLESPISSVGGLESDQRQTTDQSMRLVQSVE